MFCIVPVRFSLQSVQDVNLLKGFLWTRRQLGNVADSGHPANLLPKCTEAFLNALSRSSIA